MLGALAKAHGVGSEALGDTPGGFGLVGYG